MAESLQLMMPGVTLDGLPDSFSFELNDHDECALGVFATTPERPLFGQRCGTTAKTHWIVFLKQNTPVCHGEKQSHE